MGLLKSKTPLTVAVGGEPIGNPPTGPTSPGYQPVTNIIRGIWINMKAMNWTSEMLFHRPIGHLPNLAPAGLQYRGMRVQAKSGKNTGNTIAPDFGVTWAGTGG